MMKQFYPLFKIDALNSFVALAIGLFFILTLIYSSKFMSRRRGLIGYYVYVILTAIASIGAVLSNNFILLLVFWGFLGLTLYLLVNMGEGAAGIAKKSFVIVGGSDALMILGISIIYYLSGTMRMDNVKLEFNNGLVYLAYLCIVVASFAKAGAMPFHSWIPECAEKAPLPVAAYLLASLDKLLGIYLLARASLNLFVMNEGLNIFLMLIGAFTIVAAAMMALAQGDMRKLLGYSTVSQVGYMVLGIGTGNPVGIAGGIFHMFNHATYKSCQFFAAGNVEYRAGTKQLNELGGFFKVMPVTYISALIASLSISGVPPFNGFVSKWMVYQGLVEQLQVNNYILRATSVLCLVAAMFGSGLTLAVFMKFIHAVFLGQQSGRITGEDKGEVSWKMWLPCVILSLICVVFGVFAYQLPLKYIIFPAVKGVTFIGTWYAGLATLLIIIGLVLGIFIFKLKTIKPVLRNDGIFVGGETSGLRELPVTGTEFYNTVQDFGVLKVFYKKAESGIFDIYEQGKSVIFGIGRFLQYLHNGVMSTYLVWVLLGMIGLFFALTR